ncbi:MAG: AGE family epimerase/isomerase [Candidatus Helarchaeota archaeon]|nr:AGE family epimerase/isomerase [Candidatus Helarchaeota archaeon]
MRKKAGSLLLLCMICLSSMLITFQNSPFTPYFNQNEGNVEEKLPENDAISSNTITDYSKQGEDVHNPQDAADFSDLYYKYKNTTVYQANLTIDYLISSLWDANYKGFNESDAVNAKKRTFDNMLMIITLLEYYDAELKAEYITYAEEIFNFEYNYLWNNQTNLFFSYCDHDGNNPSTYMNSSDNALAVMALLKLYDATTNQTYLDVANLTYYGLNSVLYDSTNGGYYRSNASGDTNKFAFDNLLVSQALTEIYRTGYLSATAQANTLELAENTLNLLIINYLNGTDSFFTAGDADWSNPVEEKSALINALAMITLILVYEINLNLTYLVTAMEIAEFMDEAFWDSSGMYRGYNATVSWDGSTTLNSTKFLDINSILMIAFLKLFEITYNSTYYLDAINISRFLNQNLLDSNTNAFNFSIDFAGPTLNSLKSTAANAWAIRALLGFRYQRPYLTRANTTMTMLFHHMYNDDGFDNIIMYDWSSLASQIVYSFPITITLENFFGVFKPSESNLEAIYTLLELAEETRLIDYVLLANETMYFLNETAFSDAFSDNATAGQGEITYSTETNAWGILSLLKLYEKTNDTTLLEMANKTWYFLRDNLYDSINYGYNTSTTDNISKDLVSNCLMVWANLEILNSNYTIFGNITGNVSKLVNETMDVINQKMWDGTNNGYYQNASSDWVPFTTDETVKQTLENCIMVQTLLKYNDFYQNHPNRTQYADRVNYTIEFLLNYLWDSDVGGFYLSSNENGSSQITDKYTVGNSRAILTFLDLYEETGNFSYYLLAEDTSNFLNTYLWDFEYGGFFHWCAKDGVPYVLGTLPAQAGTILISFKFIESQISPILALTSLSKKKETLPFALVVDIEFQPEEIDRGSLLLQINLNLIDLEGNPVNQANVSVSLSGLDKTIAGEKFFGLSNESQLENQNGTNIFTGTLDISKFLGDFHLTLSAYNSSMAVTWLSISKERTFDVYLSKAFALLTNLHLFFWDEQYGGYPPSLIAGANDTKYTFDNWMAILALLEYYNGSGLHLFYNLTSGDLEQILTSYISRTFNFLNSSLSYTPINETSLAFYSSASLDGSQTSSEILCQDTALGIITLLEYYQITNDSTYLEMANRTWSFLNTTLWDSNNSGYLNEAGAGSNQTKYSIDNIWAALANLALYSTTQINQTIRDSAMRMANLTITLLNQNLWDGVYLGYYSSFNGSTWTPFNTSLACKKADVNILAIQMLLKYADLINSSKRDDYINYANETFRFMDQTLRDKDFLGYFSSSNRNGTVFNTNKTLTENSLMIQALLDLYRANNYNFTYYQLAEECLFLIDQYFRGVLFTLYHNVTSRFGAITYDFLNFVPTESYSNFVFLRSLTQTDLERQKIDYPLVIDNITVESPELGEIQDSINITLKVYDSNGNLIENATVIGIIYGRYQVFSFTPLNNDTYSCLVNVTNLAGDLGITFLAFKEGYSAGIKEYSFSRFYPTYIQKSYETLIALLLQLWNSTEEIFMGDELYYQFKSSANFMALEALLDFIEIGGDILWSFDWFANRTLLSYSELIGQNLKKVLNSSEIQVDSKNVSGYLKETEGGVPVNLTDCVSNALAIMAFLDLYNATADPTYLELANNTWLYLNATFWDPNNYGYYDDNSTATNKTLYANCWAILANLEMNKTLGINPTIRAQAYVFANQTFVVMNQSLWDDVHGTYYTSCDGNWTNPRQRFSLPNALMILTLLELYDHNPNQTEYLRRANITADIFINNFYDSDQGGFFQVLLENFSMPYTMGDLAKFTIDNAWAILALAELYETTGNTTFYYVAEDAMNFINSHLANHFNEYLNTEIDDITGYWANSLRSGYVSGKYHGKYVGTLESSSAIIRALVKMYLVANSTLPWLNATVEILPASDPPSGDFCNMTISIFDAYGTKINAELNITISGWVRLTDLSGQKYTKYLEYEYDAGAQEYKVSNVSLTDVEDVYFTVYIKNTSYATWWNSYYLHRTESGISLLWGVGGDYVPSQDYWQYTIGDDIIIIEGLYTDLATFQGIPSASLNFTIHFPNGTIWFSELAVTNSTGWARLVFGPVPNVAALFGVYNVTVFASHVNTSISPITWYASTSGFIRINLDYGVSIPFFYPLEAIAVQGDKLRCNITIKHRMILNLSVDLLIYAEGVLNPTLVNRNLTTGFNYFIIETEIDERTPIGSYFIYLNVSFQDEVIRDTYFFVTILSAAIIRNYYVPTWIAEDDVRYAVIEFEHRKLYETSNVSIKINCPALEENPTIQVLQPLAWQEYYFPLIVKNDIPYGLYSGEFIVERVNYTLDLEGTPLTFQIEVVPATEVNSIQAPTEMVQNQQSLIAIELQNNKASSITIKIVGYGDGFNDYEEIITIGPAKTETINTPIIYYKNPWDSGMREYTIKIYYFNESSEFMLISSNTYQIYIDYSVNSIFFGFVLPSVIIAVIIIWILWQREKKKRERKKLK